MERQPFFAREKMSPLDRNPWDGMQADQITDCGFMTGKGPRIGVTAAKQSQEEQQQNLRMLCSAVEQVIARNKGGGRVTVQINSISDKR